jgi:hypothetical protein
MSFSGAVFGDFTITPSPAIVTVGSNERLIVPNSELVISSNGFNSLTGLHSLSGSDGTQFTNLNATVFITAIDNTNTTKLNQVLMSYSGMPGVWAYAVASNVFLTGFGDWSLTFQMFDNTGISGTLYRAWFRIGIEVDA